MKKLVKFIKFSFLKTLAGNFFLGLEFITSYHGVGCPVH